MSAALVAPAPPSTLGRPAGLTLERKLDEVLAAARVDGHAECPVCGDAMTGAGHARELRCAGCGSRLS
jgi:tRNA(Ile2) C34 agmatinyltransferase TiaS